MGMTEDCQTQGRGDNGLVSTQGWRLGRRPGADVLVDGGDQVWNDVLRVCWLDDS